MTQAPVKTPCIGICSTTSVGDPICRGCKRFAFEVIDWNAYSDDEKRAVLQRIEALVQPIVDDRFIIRSAQTLAAGLKRQAVPCNPDLSPASWLHSLLKKRHRQIQDLSGYGVEIRQPWRHLSLPELAEDMDVQLLRLCEAHRIRYFPELSS
ncbi:MAG: DUF1289 domain-containing protein [Gammaproteobacteria bacterium]|nr:DUF1289 domain-containing protein [Gammaproteobacteria bacterium]|tara:strand:+ start:1398 stop:1853 length:456 start_codon:yes stop_codon:yes gene_type:complete